MDKKGCLVEVRGVPDLFSDDVTSDKLLIYFLSKKHGGGEVRNVLYPCYQPGQAFVMFEQPEVAARVLRRTPHVLDLDSQRFVLTVRAADPAQMDFLVEATLHLNTLLDRKQVRDVLRSLGFVSKDLTADQVRVKGSFLKLKSVNASLEMLLKPPARVGVTPSPSPVPKVSSGAAVPKVSSRPDVPKVSSRPDVPKVSSRPTIPKVSSRPAVPKVSSRPAVPKVSTSKHSSDAPSASTISSSVKGSSGTLDQPGSVRTGTASCAVEPDVFEYAKCLRTKDVDAILVDHDMTVKRVDDSYIITLWGTRAAVRMNKLKILLDNLHTSLRTQEVPLKDVTAEGRRLAARIQESRNMYKSVLVQKRSRSLHLIGPSGESYVLKQKLLGRTVDQAPQRGRGTETKPSRRSSSLPPTKRDPWT